MKRWRNLPVSAAARIAVGYLVIALVYILFSDWLLSSWAPSVAEFHFWETVKGIGFVAVTALALLFLIERELHRRVRAEAAATAHAERLQEVADSLPQPLIIVCEKNREVLFANRRALTYAGLDPEAALGELSLDRYFPDRETFDAIAQEARDGDGVAGRELKLRSREGYELTLAVSARRMTYDGKEATCATFTDLSEIQEARLSSARTQRLLQEILENLPGGVALKDLGGRYLLASRRYIEMLVQEEFALVGYRAEEVYDSAEAADFEMQDREVAVTLRPRSYELRRNDKSEGVTVIELTKFPVFAPDGKLEAIGCIAFDMSEQKGMEQQLRRTERLETLGEMTGGVAHDFNNLLAAILGNAELLNERAEDAERVREAGKVIEEAALRGADLTRRLLVFARQQSLRNETLEIPAIMRDLVRLLERSIGEDIQIEVKLPEGLWPIEVDRSQFENAIMNLAVNARDAMPNGGFLRVAADNVNAMDDSILAEMNDVAEHYVCVTVTDTGHGMTPEVLDRIFEPFFTTKEPGKGTGLGLSTVYGFARQSRGAVRAKSEEQGGTTVFLYLPKGNVKAAAQTSAEVPAATLTAGQGARVLVAEDDDLVRGYIVLILRQLGFEVVEAQDGVEALRLLEEDGDFDLLFSDMVMPGGVTGRDLAEKAKKLRPQLRVLLTTGYAEHPSLGNGEGGSIEFLRKPYRREELIAALNATLAA